MKTAGFVLALILPMIALPAGLSAQGYQPPSADEGPPSLAPGPDGAQDQGGDDLGSMLERGAQSLLRDLFSDLEPHMNALGQELGGRFDSLAPLLREAGTLMDDLRHYQRPERLTNGDILIRRKADAPPPPPISREFQDLTDPGANPPETDSAPFPAPLPGMEIEL